MSWELDIDALVPHVGTIRFRGREYRVPDVPLELFFKAVLVQKKGQELQKSGDPSPEEQIGLMQDMVDIVQACVPDMPREELLRLPIRALQAILGRLMQSAAGAAGEEAVKTPNPPEAPGSGQIPA